MKTVPIGRAGLPKNDLRISGIMAVKVALSDDEAPTGINKADGRASRIGFRL